MGRWSNWIDEMLAALEADTMKDRLKPVKRAQRAKDDTNFSGGEHCLMQSQTPSIDYRRKFRA